MLVVETIARIRRDHLVRGVPIKTIARDLRVSKNTVRKVVRGDETSYSYERKIQPMPKLGPWVDELERQLEANEKKARRDRLSLLRIHEDLASLGYEGGYDAVRRHARVWRRRHRLLSSSEAYVPLIFDPGEAYQFGWSHEYAVLSGTTTRVKAAHMRLCHSRMQLVQIFPRESQEMLFEAHERAFHFFGGVCRRGIYDNMKTAVSTVFVGKKRDYNRRFQEMCTHHLVEPVACTPGAGWEKGQVERQVGDVRGRLFVPSPRGRSYAEINEWLMDRCIEDAKKHPHPTIPGKTVWQVFEEERPFLMAYRGPFDGFHATEVAVSKTCLVRFDNNQYSVAARAVGRPVDVRAYADRIVIRQDGEIVAEHPRSFGRGRFVYDPWHYVPILTRKPGALRNGAPFKGWQLPNRLVKNRPYTRFSSGWGDSPMVAWVGWASSCSSSMCPVESDMGSSGCGGFDISHPYQIVSSHGEQHLESNPRHASELGLTYRSDGLSPAEDLLDAFAYDLADLVAGMAGGSRVDGRAALACDVLCHVGNDPQRTKVGHETLRVIGLVRPKGESRTRDAGQHLDSRLTLAPASSLGHYRVDHQTVTVLHQYMPGVTKLRRVSVALAVHPCLRISGRFVGVVLTRLTTEVTPRVAPRVV